MKTKRQLEIKAELKRLYRPEYDAFIPRKRSKHYERLVREFWAIAKQEALK
jgi:hypothetical protein